MAGLKACTTTIFHTLEGQDRRRRRHDLTNSEQKDVAMRMMLIGFLVTAGAAMIAAPEQTARPGQMTEARVWVENRHSSEAIPIDLRAVNVERPIRVEVANGEPGFSSNPVNVRLARQVWEYKSIVVDAGVESVRALSSEGLAGWETTGISFVGQGKTTVLLKRLR